MNQFNTELPTLINENLVLLTTTNNTLPDNMTLTEKGALTYKSSGSARVDFFFHSVRGMKEDHLNELLEKCWKEDKLDTLKLIFHIRDCRGGKGEKKLFQDAMAWLVNKSTDNFLANVTNVSKFGSYKDIMYFFDDKKYNEQVQDNIMEYVKNVVREDLETLSTAYNNGSLPSVSLMAKWLPTEGCFFDKSPYNLVKKLCKKMGIRKSEYRKTILKPLRDRINTVESLMCSNKWDKINFETVPSIAMKRYRKKFSEKLKQSFDEYLQKLSEGKAKVNSSVVEPHEIVREYLIQNKPYDEILEQQFNGIIERTKQLGKFDRSIVLTDVSGSMYRSGGDTNVSPIEVSIAMSLLLSSVVHEKFRDRVILFDSDPKLIDLSKCSTLKEKVEKLSMKHGGFTNLSAPIKMLINQAKLWGVTKDEMPDTIYIISDMQFDAACKDMNKTSQNWLEDKFKGNGYNVPRIIYWNVRANQNVPVKSDKPNVSLVSGFSPSILKCVLNGDKDFTPYKTMRMCLDDNRYDCVTFVENKQETHEVEGKGHEHPTLQE